MKEWEKYNIVNMTVAYTLKFNIELPPPILTNVTYDKNKFNGAIWKNEGLTYLIFRTGKINCVGGKNIEHVRKQTKSLVMKLENEIQYERVVNLVCSLTVPFFINICALHDSLKEIYNVSYEPELFAGMKVVVGGITMICFHTGKVILTGAKNEKQFNETIKRIKPYLILCKKSKCILKN